jgi:hypothetical protein
LLITSNIAACSAKRIGFHQVMMLAYWPSRARLGGDRCLHGHRIGAELGTLRLEVVLAHPEVVEAELFRQHALLDLVPHDPLIAGVHIGQRAGRQHHARRRTLQRQVRCTIVKEANFEHDCPPVRPA